MGIIQRQGIKQSLVNFIGVAIGVLSTLFIYPYDKEAYGLARFIIGTGMLLVPFINMGLGNVAIKFFEEFSSENSGNRGFLGFLLAANCGGVIIFLIIAFLAKDSIYSFYQDRSPLFREFIPYLVPMAVILSFFQLLTNYSTNYRKIVVPAIFQNFIKLSLPFLFLLLLNDIIGFKGMANGIVINFGIIIIGMLIYLKILGAWDLKIDRKFLNKERMSRIRTFAVFGLLTNVGSVLAIRIDEIMIPTLLDFKSNGVYAISAFIGNSIMIPGTAIMTISSPIVAKAYREENMAYIGDLYKRVSMNLTFVGMLFLICVAASIQDLFSILPKSQEFVGGVAVVLFLSSAKVIDLATSINNQIINYSKHFRFGMYAILIMGGLNIVLNLLFIGHFEMGIIGAAAATFCSLCLYNLIKLTFIFFKFKIQPFSAKTIYLILLAGLSYCLIFILPEFQNAVLNILVKSLVIGGTYVFAVIALKVSDDVNRLYAQALSFFR